MSFPESENHPTNPANPDRSTAAPDWQPLTRNQRRVLGVLIEKSKTTPDVYPMTINGIKTGSNQKSNRSPVLDLNEHQVEEALYELRQKGAVIEVHSGGRVPKYKHQAYDWLAVDKPELGVMAELLLRGEQTIGDLRARSARMEKSIAGLEELRPILSRLKQRGLLVELTPPGRGQVVSHNLYRSEELEQLQRAFDTGSDDSSVGDDFNEADSSNEMVATTDRSTGDASQRNKNERQDDAKTNQLQQQVANLEITVAALKLEVAELKALIES